LRADTGGKHFLGDGTVAMRSGKTGVQRLQHLAVGFMLNSGGQGGGLHRGAVQDTFDGRGIHFTTESSADLLGDGGTGSRILQ